MKAPWSLPADWFAGAVPDNVVPDPSAWIGTSYSFRRYRSRQPVGLCLGRGATLGDAAVLDLGAAGRVEIGEFAAVGGVYLLCDASISIGAYSLIAWDVVLMDTYQLRRGSIGEQRANLPPPRPVVVGENVWIGFGACVLPGVRIGESAIVAPPARW